MPDQDNLTGFEYLMDISREIIKQKKLKNQLKDTGSFVDKGVLYWLLDSVGYARIDTKKNTVHLIDTPSEVISSLNLLNEDILASIIAEEISRFFLKKNFFQSLSIPTKVLYLFIKNSFLDSEIKVALEDFGAIINGTFFVWPFAPKESIYYAIEPFLEKIFLLKSPDQPPKTGELITDEDEVVCLLEDILFSLQHHKIFTQTSPYARFVKGYTFSLS